MNDSQKDLTSYERFDSAIISRAEPSRAEPSRAEPSRAEPSRAEPSRAEPSRAEPSRAEPSRAEPSRAEPSRAEPSRAEPSRAEPSRAEPSVGYCLSSTSPPECSAAPVSARPSDAPSPSGRARHTRSAAPAGARDRDRSRRPARPGRAATTVLVLGLMLLGAAAAEAQTPVTLVQNVGQTPDDSANTSGNKHGQLFHTGANTGGYTFTGMHVSSDDAQGDDFDVEICEADTTANEFPTSTCTALTAPASFTAGLLFFDHTGLALSANTNYVVVITQRGTGSVELDSTTSGGEDSTGLSGWSIKDKFYWQSGSTLDAEVRGRRGAQHHPLWL